MGDIAAEWQAHKAAEEALVAGFFAELERLREENAVLRQRLRKAGLDTGGGSSRSSRSSSSCSNSSSSSEEALGDDGMSSPPGYSSDDDSYDAGGVAGNNSRWQQNEIDVSALWATEEALTLEERRMRYKCGARFVTIDQLPSIVERAPAAAGIVVDSDYEISPSLNSKISLYQGDITTLELDAVVNAANESCLGGGGVDGAIHSAAGRTLYHECLNLHGCRTGQTKLTRGHALPARYILHTVGPRCTDDAALRSCYETCLSIVRERADIRTVAFCGISTGIFGFPLERASRIALQTVRQWLEVDDNVDCVDRVVFCNFLDQEVSTYERNIPTFFPSFPFESPKDSGHTSPAVILELSTEAISQSMLVPSAESPSASENETESELPSSASQPSSAVSFEKGSSSSTAEPVDTVSAGNDSADADRRQIVYDGQAFDPSDLEAVLRTHADVADAAVIGLFDESHGQLPHAFILLKPGTRASSLTLELFVEKRCASQMWLRGGLEFTEVIPRGGDDGQVMYSELESRIQLRSTFAGKAGAPTYEDSKNNLLDSAEISQIAATVPKKAVADGPSLAQLSRTELAARVASVLRGNNADDAIDEDNPETQRLLRTMARGASSGANASSHRTIGRELTSTVTQPVAVVSQPNVQTSVVVAPAVPTVDVQSSVLSPSEVSKLLAGLRALPGRKETVISWDRAFDVNMTATIQGDFSDWKELPVERGGVDTQQQAHVFAIALPLVTGQQYKYRFKINGKSEPDRSQRSSLGPDGETCNILSVEN